MTLSGRDIKITWSQTRDALELDFAIIAAFGTDSTPSLKQATDNDITIQWASVEFSANFLRPIRGISARWTVGGNGRISVALRKGKGMSGQWARPFVEKLPYLSKDWDKWVDEPDSDDDERAKAASEKPPEDTTLQKLSDVASLMRQSGVHGGGDPASGPSAVSASRSADSAPSSNDGADATVEDNAAHGDGGGGSSGGGLTRKSVRGQAGGEDSLDAEMSTRFFPAHPLWLQEHQVVGAGDGAEEKGEERSATCDVSEEEVKAPTAAGVRVEGASGKPVASAMAGDAEKPDYVWLADWPKFRPEQRMVTMAQFWNAMEYETRLASARRLVAILRGGDAQMAMLDSAIKGGDFGRLHLDTSVYKAVSRPQRWLDAFTKFESAQQVEVMELLFTALSFDDKKVVVATFV